MAIITRTIHNATSVNINLFVPGYDTIKPQIVVAPGATLDLFTVLTADELETIQNQLTALVDAGDLTVIATTNTATFNPVGDGIGITQLTGDVTAGPGTGSQATTLANTAVTPGSFTSANITVDAKGRITAAANGSGATPGGTEGQLQYNSTNTFAGTTDITTDGSNLSLVDDNKLILGNSDNTFVEYGTNWAGIILGTGQVDLNAVTNFHIWANTGPAGAGTYEPNLQLYASTGRTVLSNETTGAFRYLQIDMAGVNIEDQGQNDPDPSAQLHIRSTTKGFLQPKMTTGQRDLIASPAVGLMIYNTSTDTIDVWTSAAMWKSLTPA